MQFTIKLSALQGMVQLAGNKDIRYYLNGVRVEFNSSNIRLIATDGHKIGIFQDDTNSVGLGKLTIPRTFIESLPKAKIRENPTLTISQDTVNPTLWHCEYGNNKTSFYEIEGQYPDYSRVLSGVKTSGKPSQFNDQYIAQFKKCGLMLTFLNKDHFFPTIYHNGDSCALVELPTLQGKFVGGLMPIKCDNPMIDIVAPSSLYEPLIQTVSVQNNGLKIAA